MSGTTTSETSLMAAIRVELRRRREQLNWTVNRLAEEMGVGWAHVSDMETGLIHSPSIDTLSRWADALGMEMSITFRPRNWSSKVPNQRGELTDGDPR